MANVIRKVELPSGSSYDIVGKVNSTDTNEKIFLVGATSQSSDGVTTYTDDQIYATNGTMHSNTVNTGSIVVGAASAGTTLPETGVMGQLFFKII